MIDSNEAYLEYRENSGYSAFSNLIKELLQDTIAEAEIIKSKARENYYSYEREFNDLLESGALKEDSVEYYDRLSQLNELKTAYYEASSAVIEHADALREIEYTKLQYAIDGFARITDKLQNYIELLESRDEIISESLYTRQITSNNNQIDTQYELRRQKLEEQKLYSVQSVRYQELADEIADIDNEIITLLTDNEKLKDSIVELRYDPLTKSIEQLQEARTELEDFMDLLNEEAFFDSKTGELTGDGVAQIYLLEQSMISAKQEVAEYTEGLEKLNQDLANGNISQTEFNEKNAEYREGIRNAIKDVKSYSDTLTDLYLNQMQKENELLQEIIDKRKEALRRKEDYYNYDKTLRDQTKDLNLLRAQAAALEGNNSAQAELKRLRQQIADAEEKLSETKRQHSVEMQEAGYDTLSNDLNEMLEDVELEIKSNADKQLEVIDSLLDKTVSKYDEAYSKVQEIIAQTGFVGSELFNKISLAGLSSEEQALLQKIIAGYSQSDITATNRVQNIVTDHIELPNTSDIEKDIVDPKDKSVSEALREALEIAVNDIRKENHLDENRTKSNGSTVILPNGTVLSKLSSMGKKVPNYLTANLLDGVSPASEIMENTFDKTMKLVSSVVNNAGNTISCHYDSLLTVNGNVDKNVLPELQDILKQSYQYTTQQMTKDALRAGNKLRR